MIRDQAIEEIRERRRQMIQVEYGGSFDRFMDDAEKWQKEHPDKVVRPERIRELKIAS